jgi:hypothetical protein
MNLIRIYDCELRNGTEVAEHQPNAAYATTNKAKNHMAEPSNS